MKVMTLQRRWSVWARWPDPKTGPYHVGLTFSEPASLFDPPSGGGAELVGVEMWLGAPERAGDDPEPADLVESILAHAEWPVGTSPSVTATAYRSLPVAGLARAARAAVAAAFTADVASGAGEVPRRAAEGIAAPRRARLGPGHYAAVAAVYASAVEEGSDPYAAIKARWPASKSTCANWVSRARHEFGLLPPTSRGRTSF